MAGLFGLLVGLPTSILPAVQARVGMFPLDAPSLRECRGELLLGVGYQLLDTAEFPGDLLHLNSGGGLIGSSLLGTVFGFVCCGFRLVSRLRCVTDQRLEPTCGQRGRAGHLGTQRSEARVGRRVGGLGRVALRSCRHQVDDRINGLPRLILPVGLGGRDLGSVDTCGGGQHARACFLQYQLQPDVADLTVCPARLACLSRGGLDSGLELAERPAVLLDPVVQCGGVLPAVDPSAVGQPRGGFRLGRPPGDQLDARRDLHTETGERFQPLSLGGELRVLLQFAGERLQLTLIVECAHEESDDVIR